MFKKTITFKNFNDEEVTQDFYFHLSKAELLAMAADGNAMVERINRIIATKDGHAILKEFRELIKEAAGIRSEDGSRFIKTDEAKSELMDSPAFDELLMELATNADASAAFVRQLIPEKMQKEMQEQLAKQTFTAEAPDPFKSYEPTDLRPTWLKEDRNPTDQELKSMSKEELMLAFQHRKK